MSKAHEWPEFFPPDVPPSSATPAEGIAFRIVKTIPSSEADFQSAFENSPQRQFTPSDIGIQFGISFHRQLNCSKKTRARYKPLRKRHIAVGKLKSEHGVQLETPIDRLLRISRYGKVKTLTSIQIL